MKISIIGLGKLGAPMAAVMAHKGNTVVGVDVNPLYVKAIQEMKDLRQARGIQKEKTTIKYVPFEEALRTADFISVHVPLLPETRGLLDSPKLYRMKPTAFLVNTSRGSVVDEAALVHALETGKIAGAALDVYENEPFIHPGLKRPNVVLAPHIASASLETRTKMACMAAENVTALFKGQRPPNMLNPEVLKAG